MITNIKKVLFFLVFILVLSCENNDGSLQDLQIYIDRFEEEANERGLTYVNEVANIDIHLVEIITGGVLGQCVRDDEQPNQIHIDRTYWRGATDLEKEFVVFHELGHCILNKDHTNSANSDGTCRSIMYDGNSTQCNLSYTLDTKEAMIDALFE